MYNLAEVLEYGPIVAIEPELGILITVNGAYFNIWVGNESSGYTNTDLRATNLPNGLYGANMAVVLDDAKALMHEVVNGIIGSDDDLIENMG